MECVQRTLSIFLVFMSMVEGVYSMSSIASKFRMKAIEVEVRRVVFEAVDDDRHLNPLGVIHSGFAATILDSVLGCTFHSILEKGVGYGTVDLNIKMLRPKAKKHSLKALGKVLNISHSLSISCAYAQRRIW